MKVAVLGARGHVSKYLVEELRQSGLEVKILSRSPLNSTSEYESTVGNALIEEDVHRFLEGTDSVINCVGQLRNDPDFYTRITKNILSGMKGSGMRRYIGLTSSVVETPSDSPSILRWLGTSAFHVLFPLMVKDKQEEYNTVAASDTDWTVFRLPLVVDGNSSRAARFNDRSLGGLRIFNRQVARCLAAELKSKTHLHHAPFLFD